MTLRAQSALRGDGVGRGVVRFREFYTERRAIRGSIVAESRRWIELSTRSRPSFQRKTAVGCFCRRAPKLSSLRHPRVRAARVGSAHVACVGVTSSGLQRQKQMFDLEGAGFHLGKSWGCPSMSWAAPIPLWYGMNTRRQPARARKHRSAGRLVLGERRQDAGNPPHQHRLATTLLDVCGHVTGRATLDARHLMRAAFRRRTGSGSRRLARPAAREASARQRGVDRRDVLILRQGRFQQVLGGSSVEYRL